jgi:hypothetical protein
MDEIIIDEKKYISSKRAAKVTGYAKDYVGQLCREGRVQARLVGRSWYVLESAIKDHRFGNAGEEDAEPSATTPAISPVWESPRYESVLSNPLPIVQRHEEREVQVVAEEIAPEYIPARQNRVEVEEPRESLAPIEVVEEQVPFFAVEDQVYIPPTRNEQPPILPRRTNRKPYSRGVFRIVFRLMAVLLALFSLGLAAINSGYLDKYIILDSRASYLTGLRVLIK